MVVSNKNKKLGIFFILLPFLTLVATLFIWAIVIFISRTTNPSGDSVTLGTTVIKIINLILGLVALLGVIGIFVFVPLGIVFLNKKTIAPDSHYDERSGKGDASVVPPEIEGWNWGAAGLTWIWGISHSVWLSLLSFVPVLSYVWWIVLGIKGNEWAWKAGRWESVDQFKQVQRQWGIWGIVIFCIGGAFLLLSILVSIFAHGASSPTY